MCYGCQQVLADLQETGTLRTAGANGDLPELRYEYSMGPKTKRHRLMAYDGRTANKSAHPPLSQLWADYQDWHGPVDPEDEDAYTPHDSVQSWGNVESYLQDRHGLSPWDEGYYDHPITFGMAKLHSLAQARPQVDGHDYDLSDDDLVSGAALGLLKIRRNQQTKRMEPDYDFHEGARITAAEYQVPPEWQRYYDHMSGQPDRSQAAHLMMPTELASHYQEYDRDPHSPNYQVLKKVIQEHGNQIRQPLVMSVNDTHGLLTEGNHRAAIARELGITHLPVRVQYGPDVQANEGTPVAHHPAFKQWLDANAGTLRTAAVDSEMTSLVHFTKPHIRDKIIQEQRFRQHPQGAHNEYSFFTTYDNRHDPDFRGKWGYGNVGVVVDVPSHAVKPDGDQNHPKSFMVHRDDLEGLPIRKLDRHARTAGTYYHRSTASVPDGYNIHLVTTNGYGGGTVAAYPKTVRKPGPNNWHAGLQWDNYGKITHVDTKEPHRGKGLARALYEHVKQNYRPDLMHDSAISAEGKAFANAVGGQMFDADEYQRRRDQHDQEKKLPYEQRSQMWKERGWPSSGVLD
ncbi:hypothetical protein SEA_RABINOVISH_80 [Mycobacterium phage Rabinovish]|nr:hypothetical protein SEA_RABINOVISH_80 [Mycobacterium phage Rabinovish]